MIIRTTVVARASVMQSLMNWDIYPHRRVRTLPPFAMFAMPHKGRRFVSAHALEKSGDSGVSMLKLASGMMWSMCH
jgi:hypothetical protein